MYAEEIISRIDGPELRNQRRAVLQILCDNKDITPTQSEALEGLTNLLDAIADCASAVYGKDCMFSERSLERKAEEVGYEQRIQQYNH